MLKDILNILEPNKTFERKLIMKTAQKILNHQIVIEETLEVCSLDACSVLIVEVKYKVYL